MKNKTAMHLAIESIKKLQAEINDIHMLESNFTALEKSIEICKSLIEKEKEQILHAYNSCYSKNQYTGEFMVTIEDYESTEKYWNDMYEEKKQDLQQSKLF
jgi:predicted RND superfamily exporter protein